MALTVTTLRDEQSGGNKVVPGKRLYLTADRQRLVDEGDPEAAFLYCTESRAVDRAEFEALVANSSPEPEQAAAEQSDASEKESKAPSEDKDRSKARSTKSRHKGKGADE